MEITGIRIYPFDTTAAGGHVLAYADTEFDSELLVRGVRILRAKEGGEFIGFPSKKGKDKEYREVVRPLNRVFLEKIRDGVIDAYQKYAEED